MLSLLLVTPECMVVLTRDSSGYFDDERKMSAEHADTVCAQLHRTVRLAKTASVHLVMRLRPQFLLSAFAADHFPSAARTGGAPEVAFLGRSNVGKSSLINGLLGDVQARVSSTPGRTRSINFFALHEVTNAGNIRPVPQLVFADLPGYGYAKISKSISAEWPTFIDPYLAERDALALCCCLVDTNIPPQQSDLKLLDFLRAVGRKFVVVGTKSDRLSSNNLAKSIALLKRELGVPEIVACSAKLGKQDRGMKELWTRILAVRGADTAPDTDLEA